MKNNTTLFAIITGMLIFLRVVSDDAENLVSIISILNIIALLIVFFSTVEKLKKDISKRIKSLNSPKEIIRRETKSINLRIYLLSYIPFSISVIAYLTFFISELGNDIISILSLGLSLTSSNIAETIAKKIKL